MTKRIFAVLAIVALVAGACGNDDDDVTTPDAEEDGGGASEAITVEVDNAIDEANVAFLQYFPADVSVRAGDSIDFAFQDGDPHTVSFGTLIDDMAAAGPEAEAEGPPPFPFVFDEQLNILQGGAQPCYAATAEEIPADGSTCANQEAPAFSGTSAFYNSGILTPGDTLSLDVADDAAEGTYTYICLLHGPDMAGTVTVVGPDADVPSADEVEAAGEAELEEATAVLSAAIGGLDDGTIPALEGVIQTGPNFVVAGSGDPDAPADILEFGPAEVEITAGETLTWNVLGFHTISFNATQDATPPIIPGAEGNLEFNPLAAAPQGGWPGAPPPPEGGEEGGGEEPEGPPPPPTNIDAGEWDGTGFVSSGFLPSFPPQLLSYSVTFTQAGTYTYACLVHEDMEGTVTVT